MYFQGRRNTCNMLRNKSREKCGRAPTKYIRQRCFVGVQYQNVIKLCPPVARCIGSKRFQSPPLPYLHISSVVTGKYIFTIQTAWNQVKTNGYPKRSFLFLKVNVCSGYSLEAALSNVNDSFTLSRLMKRPKTFCDTAHDEYLQLTLEKAFQQSLSLFDVELRLYSNAVHLYLIGSHVKNSNYSRRSCEQCRL